MRKKPNRISELREARGITQEQMAEAIDTHWVTISRIENSEVNLRNKNVKLIAQVLGVEPEDFIADSDRDTLARIIGRVQAGCWTGQAEWPEDDCYQIHLPVLPEWRGKTKRGLEVHGDSMNQIYPDGSIVVYVPTPDLAAPFRNGQILVVSRQRDGDFEVTLKEFQQGPDGSRWLIPKTTNPALQAPIALTPHDGEVRIIGRVIWGGRKEIP